MLYINEYLIHHGKHSSYVTVHEPLFCPSCFERLKPRGSKSRKLIDIEGDTIRYIIPKYYCPSCKKTHCVYPYFFAPYKRYSKEVILAVLNGKTDTCLAGHATIYRWRTTENLSSLEGSIPNPDSNKKPT